MLNKQCEDAGCVFYEKDREYHWATGSVKEKINDGIVWLEGEPIGECLQRTGLVVNGWCVAHKCSQYKRGPYINTTWRPGYEEQKHLFESSDDDEDEGVDLSDLSKKEQHYQIVYFSRPFSFSWDSQSINQLPLPTLMDKLDFEEKCKKKIRDLKNE